MAFTDPNGNYIGPSNLGAIQYEYDYFSGSQINVMIGDIVIDTCVAVQFSVEQSRVPIYGFASQYYTYVTDGQVIVQGSLTIAFKEAGYLLFPIINFAKKTYTGVTTSPKYTNIKGVSVQGSDPFNPPETLIQTSKEAYRKETMRANVEQYMDWSNPPGGQIPFKAGSPKNQLVKQLGALDDNQFEDWADAFEDAIWFGNDTNFNIDSPNLRDSFNSKNISNGEILASLDSEGKTNDTSTEMVLSHRRADQYPSVDIWITYGDTNKGAYNHTVKKLVDVSFIGQSQTIEISGRPTYETYQFIARNLI